MGSQVERFEKELTKIFGRPSICVINGTAAIHLALQACAIGQGDEVLVPSLTYVASFQAISATGAKPIPCDINENDYLLDLSDAEKRITSMTKAIIPMHYSAGGRRLGSGGIRRGQQPDHDHQRHNGQQRRQQHRFRGGLRLCVAVSWWRPSPTAGRPSPTERGPG